MIIVGPERYELSYTAMSFTVRCARGTKKFSGIAASDMPKLYIASVDGKPFYVGMTKQRIQKRLSYGWKAAGQTGYYGYAWRHIGNSAVLDVWGHQDAVDRNVREIETVEAEIVYLIRKAGQWPAYQTEIHFFQSSAEHRRHAAAIVSHYKL